MQQLLTLINAIPSSVMASPFPAGQDLKFSRINGTVVVHHPDDHRVTKTVRAQNIRKIVIRNGSIGQIIAQHFGTEVVNTSVHSEKE